MVAISRIMDARHHPFDVISSSLLGTFTAWISYRQYFPALSETWKKGRAYPIRSWGREPPSPGKAPDGYVAGPEEEEGKTGYVSRQDRGLASVVPMVDGGAAMDVAAQRRRQYLEDQDMLERRRRRTHEFYDTYTVPTLPVPTLPNAPSKPGTEYHPAATRDEEYMEMYDLGLNGPRGADTAYHGYSGAVGAPPVRQNTQSTRDSHESEDRQWGITQATNALGGPQLAFTPIQEEFKTKAGYSDRKGTEGGSDDGLVKAALGSSDDRTRGVELRDEGSIVADKK